MSKDKDFRHGVRFTDAGKKQFERIAALCEFESWNGAIEFSGELALSYAEAYVKGDTMVHFCTPELANVLINNPEFIAALCEEGVIERQSKIISRYLKIKDKHPDKTAEWWYDTHGIDLTLI
jgi:hypothetical protein